MSIEYTQRSLYWIDYGGAAANAQTQWLTDLANPPTDVNGITFKQLVLPPWFPRKTMLSYIWISCEGNIPDSPGWLTETTCWVDPGGVGFSTGVPPGSENSNFSRDIMLYHGVTTDRWVVDDRRIDPPVAFNRDAGDKLGFILQGSFQFAYAIVCFHFLVPATFQPVGY